MAVAVGSLVFAIREVNHTRDLGVALDKSNSLLAANYLDRGLSLCEGGDVAHGLLLMTRGLSAVPANAPDLGRVMRANLAGWQESLDPLLAMWKQTPAVASSGLKTSVAFSPDGKAVATGAADHKVQFWNAADAKPIGEPIDCFEGGAIAGFQP